MNTEVIQKSHIIKNKIAMDTTKNYWKNNSTYYYMMLPGIIFIIIFRFAPLYGMLVAFKDYDMFKGFSASKWVGFKWFNVLFDSPDFFRLLRNTLVISFLDLIVVFFGSIVFAILINEINNKYYKKLIQTVSYLPYFLSWVIVGGLLIQLLSTSNVTAQLLFKFFGKEPANILLDKNMFYGVVTLGELWKSSGWNTILYLAAMTGISPELYEAAKLDGANKFRQIIHVTLPGIKFVIVVTLLMRLGGVMNVGFEKIFVLQNGMTLDTSEVFSTWNYKVGLGQWNMSLSAALSFFESIVNFILVFFFDRVAKMIGEEGLF